eukprot:16662_1
MSKQILQVAGRDISMLPINSDISQQIKTPIELPILEAGRIQYYSNNKEFNDIPFNVDWIVFKTIDIAYLSVNDLRFAFITLSSIFLCVCIVFAELYKKESIDDENIDTIYDNDTTHFNKYVGKRSVWDIMEKMKAIISVSAQITWRKLYSDYDGILTTKTAQDFCANRASEHIAANDNDTYHSMLIKCSWEMYSYSTPQKGKDKIQSKHKFIDFVQSNLYNFIIGFIIFIHLIISLFEPATPQQLKQNGLDDKILM